MAEDKITRDEMIELFGVSMPVEAATLLWEASDEKTVGQLRSELREIAAKRQIDSLRERVARAIFASILGEDTRVERHPREDVCDSETYLAEADAAIALVLEEAAKVADSIPDIYDQKPEIRMAKDIATAIRKLAEE